MTQEHAVGGHEVEARPVIGGAEVPEQSIVGDAHPNRIDDVLVAGAALPLVEVLDMGSWVAGVLGFTVVAFQGLDRIWSRTSAGSRAEDELRRGLKREQSADRCADTTGVRSDVAAQSA